jgi:translation initiation factor IF-2
MVVRLHEASKRFNSSYKDLAKILSDLGFTIKEHALASVSDDMLVALESHFQGKTKPAAEVKPAGKAPRATPDKAPAAPTPVPPAGAKPGKPAPSPALSAAPTSGSPIPVARAPEAPLTPTTAAQAKEVPALGKAVTTVVAVAKDDRKKGGPKPPRVEEEEEIEVNQRITIIKTVVPKKEVEPKKAKKKKLLQRAKVSKKLMAEIRETEAEAVLELEEEIDDGEALEQEAPVPRLHVPKEVTVNELAKYLHIEGVEIVKKLMQLGVFASLNQRLESEHVQLIGREFGKDIIFATDVVEFEESPDRAEDLQQRPPVVTIMGHVDHGKTSLLDYIRHSRVAEGEVGGITQHIGAYQVKTASGVITFIDTPGHEAFTAMRAQGALVTDIAILVVAADDGVQPQTIEAIRHAQAANVPIIVAINKVDKPEANTEKTKQQLMPYNLIAEEWGGKTIMVPVSAKTGKGVPELLEMILLQAEMMELKANPERGGKGTIVEAKLDRGMGPIATVLVQNGQIELGENIICGTSFGRVKALISDSGQRVKKAGPATPVAILGLNEVPKVGDKLMVVENAKFARMVGELRQKQEREDRLSRENRMKLIDLFKQVTDGKLKELNIIIKADVQGSSGALKDAFERMSADEVKVNVLHAGVGAITESDVMLAAASNAIIIGFHVRPASGVDEIAAREEVEIKVFRIIYDAIDAVKAALKGMYEPIFEEEIVGRIDVRKVYKVTGAGTIAGSYVLEGKATRDSSLRLIRDGVEIYEGKVGSLKRFKDDVREVVAGYECGVSIANFNDLKEGDVIEFFRLKEIPRA